LNHVFFGALLPFVVAAIVYAANGFRASRRGLIMAPAFLALGAIWALAPDLPRFLGMHDLYLRLMADPRTNIFYFHHFIDLVETDTPYYNVAMVTIVVALFAAAWRELRRTEGSG
jgi:uncharacterized membrane protein YwaF